MLAIQKLIPRGQGLAAVLLKRAARVALDWDVRQKSRFDATDTLGRHLGVFLPRGTVVRGGDVLLAEDGSLVVVDAAPQAVLEVSACTEHGSPFDLLRAAYHLGNRHVTLELQPTRLLLEPDHVLADMLRQMHLIVRETEAPFEPEAGAYASGGHAHGGHGGHDHAHHEAPSHSDDHVHGPGCGHDHAEHEHAEHSHAQHGHAEHAHGRHEHAHTHAHTHEHVREHAQEHAHTPAPASAQAYEHAQPQAHSHIPAPPPGRGRSLGIAARSAPAPAPVPHVHGPGCGHHHEPAAAPAETSGSTAIEAPVNSASLPPQA